MKRFLVFSLMTGLLLAGLWYADTRLAAPPSPTATPTPPPTRAPEATPAPAVRSGPQAVVISLDGAQAGRVRAYMADGSMPNLARLKERGALAQYALSIEPPLSAPAHAALASGSYPAQTGVVADRFHRSQDELTRPVEAVLGCETGAEPVWRTAMREAHRTAALFWPGLSLDAPSTLADYTVTYGTADTLSAQHEISFTQALTWTASPRSFSPLREGTLTIRKDEAPLARFLVLAVDTSDDDKANYDTYIVSRSRQVDAASVRLRLGESKPLLVDEQLTSGAYLTLTKVTPEKATFYQSAVYYNRAQPDTLVREINERFGFFPAGADAGALARGWITATQYTRMAEMQSRWMISVTTYVLDAYKPELLFTRQGVADDMQRPFLLVDAKQPNYTPERATEYARYVRQGYALADSAVGELAKALDLQQTSLFVVSGRGVAPVRSQVYLNTILSGARLLVYEKGGRVSVAQSRALAFASGGAAHIYINLRDRERLGTVAAGDYKAVQDAIVAALERVKDKDGQPVFSRIVRMQDLGQHRLGTPAAGDVFVQAAPGYALSDALGRAEVLGPAGDYGEAGLPSGLDDMQSLFLAVGRGVRPGAPVGPVHIVDLVPTLMRLLGLKPSAQPAGRVLEELLLQ